MDWRFECKKCEKEVEFPEGIVDEKKIIEITTFIKHHKKHGIFAWSSMTPRKGCKGYHDVEEFYKE